MEYVGSQPIANVKHLYLLSLSLVLFLINCQFSNASILTDLTEFYAKDWNFMLKPDKEDDAGELILFDCLQIEEGFSFQETI